MALRLARRNSGAQTKRPATQQASSYVRVWPPMFSRIACFVMVVLGPVGLIAALAGGHWIAAIVCALLPLLGARLIGWVEVRGPMLRHRRLIGESTSVPFASVREVGLGMHQVGRSKWWYPEIETIDGTSVKFLMLKSLSGKQTIDRIETIFNAGMASMPKKLEDEFTSVTVEGDLEFFLSPGYDAYRRDKAEAEAIERLTAPQEPEPEVAPQDEEIVFGLPGIHPEPAAEAVPSGSHLALVEPLDEHDESDEVDELDVFAPAPLVRRTEPVPAQENKPAQNTLSRDKDERHLTFVRNETAGHEPPAETVAPEGLVPPPVPQRIPTVIEVPAERPRRPIVIDQPDRQFTSLFSRAA